MDSGHSDIFGNEEANRLKPEDSNLSFRSPTVMMIRESILGDFWLDIATVYTISIGDLFKFFLA